MNDNTIISAISAIHRAIVSLALFIFIVVSSLFFALKDGVVIEQLDLPGLTVEKLYIKWDEKLSLSAEAARVTKHSKGRESSFNYASIAKALRAVRFLNDFVASVNIDRLHLNDATGTVHYNTGGDNLLHLESPRYRFDATMHFSEDYVTLRIKNFNDVHRAATFSGNVVMDLPRSEISAAGSLELTRTPPLSLYLRADRNALAFKVGTAAPFSDLGPVIAASGLPENISKWIVDYAKSDAITLHTLYGTIPYDNPAAVIKTLYAEATCEGLSYTFNQSLEPIHTERTELLYRDGVLNILPQKATFYGHDGGSSWLNIDFTGKRTILNAFIRTSAPLDASMLKLLHAYRIDLPFSQRSGLTRADLALAVTLATGHTEAAGTFDVAKGSFNYMGLDFDVARARIGLKGSDVSIDGLDIAYDGRFHARVAGYMNPSKQYGHLKIAVDRATFGNTAYLAMPRGEPLNVDYIIKHGIDTIVFEPSLWNARNHTIHVDAATVPFDYGSSTAFLKRLPVTVDEAASAELSGTLDLKHQRAAVDIDLRSVKGDLLRLTGSPLRIHAAYDGHLKIGTDTPSLWDFDGHPLHLGPVTLNANATHTVSAPLSFSVGDDINGSLAFSWEEAAQTADITFSQLHLYHGPTGARFDNATPIKAMLHLQADALYLSSDALGLAFSTDPSRWDLSLFSLAKLAEHVPILKRYALSDGHLTFGRDLGFDNYNFTGRLNFAYPMLVQENIPVTVYDVVGNYNDGRTHMEVNKAVRVDIDDTIQITSDNVGYNLGAIIRYINSRESDQNDSRTMPQLTLSATNAYIYFTPDRKALADTLSLHTNGNGLYARLMHQNGLATFELNEGHFYLYGNRFGDRFMSHLLALAEYKGGEMSFHVNGTTESAYGVLRVKNTVIRDYRLMNNVLAFINTVPSLATFSLPHYSDKGLEVSDAYANFRYEDGLVTVEGVKVDSQEIDIVGNGVIDYHNETIDMQMNLITDAGSNVGKIPIVGYILVGDKGDVMTTLKIKGNLYDPKVSTDVAKGIAVAPLKMILRTISLPFSIFEKKKEEEKR